MHGQRHVDVVVHDLVGRHGHDPVEDPLLQKHDRLITHTGSGDAVPQSGRAAALHMAQHGGPGVDAGAGLDLVGQVLSMAGALGDDDDEVLFAGLLGELHPVQNVAFQIVGALGDQGGDGAGGNTHVQGDVAGVAAHDFHHAAAVVALGGVAQFIHHLHRGVHSGIVADGVLAAGDVVVNGAGNADAGDPQIGQSLGAAERTVAADDNDRVDAQLLAHFGALFLALLGLELKATGGIKNGAAAVDDLGNAPQVHLIGLTVQQTVESALDSDHPHAVAQGGTHNGAHSSVHTRRVAAAGKYANRLDFLCHKKAP